ncbi:hypothetical protein [Streptomyces sp. XH2]|uniref:hypothetical protein n=1 Tax=Streptomyces sp. XH2 TaxID=3412483 RepID=UPI003C7C3613
MNDTEQPGRWRDELRPYLPSRGAAEALCTGSAALVGRGWAWITAEDWRTALTRLGYVGAGGYVTVYMLAHTAVPPYVLPIGTVAWCAAAWMHATPNEPDEDEAEPEAPGQDEDEEPVVQARAVSLEELCALVRTIAQGGAGAHLSALAEHLPDGPHDASAVRALCAAHGVPVSKSVRQPGRSVSTGVRVADLPPAPRASPAAPAVGVVASGQDAATGSTTTTATAREEGAA